MNDQSHSWAQESIGLWRGLRELYGTLTPQRRRQFHRVLALMFAGAMVELAAIGAVLPFLSLIADPDGISRIPGLATAFAAFGATEHRQRLIAATALFILLSILAAAVRLQLSWSSQNFIFRLGHELAVNIQRRILSQPYSFHIERNTSSLVASLEKVGTLVYYVLLQLMQAAIAAVISAFIIAALICIDLLTALLSAVAFGLIYFFVSTAMKGRLDRNSETIGRSWDERAKIVQESLAGIRDVIVDGTQPVYLDAFRSVDDRHSAAKTNTAFIGAAPRFVIECLAMSLIAVLAIVMAEREGGITAALPILGALALGAQRLLPLLQQIYVSWSVATGNRSLLNQVMDLVRLPTNWEVTHSRPVTALPFRDRIRFEDVSFAYPNQSAAALQGVSLQIKRGQRVALIGKTGSGKSTFADLLMGLLDPTAGQITVDGSRLTGEKSRCWQRNVAHVPQTIFLADESIARNIALGVPTDQIDWRQVISAAHKAQLHEFVEGLPDGLNTVVGERGVRLSGGQRQRVGIARALYKRPSVLVLDEATNALDDATEGAVMRALDELAGEGCTILTIAHRFSTISRADLVFRLENGRVIQAGRHPAAIGTVPREPALTGHGW